MQHVSPLQAKLNKNQAKKASFLSGNEKRKKEQPGLPGTERKKMCQCHSHSRCPSSARPTSNSTRFRHSMPTGRLSNVTSVLDCLRWDVSSGAIRWMNGREMEWAGRRKIGPRKARHLSFSCAKNIRTAGYKDAQRERAQTRSTAGKT